MRSDDWTATMKQTIREISMDKYDKPYQRQHSFHSKDQVYAFKGMTPEPGQFVVTK